MTAPYLFGFPSALKSISFPGKPRILTIEVAGLTPATGNYSDNGEGFTFYAARPVGPNNRVGGIDLVPGDNTPAGLPTFSGIQPPTLVNPFSLDMTRRLYAWQQPVPGYISTDGTTGAAVLFLDIDNVAAIFKNQKTFPFSIQTRSHGTSTPPGPAQSIYYLYQNGLGIGFPPPLINATGDIATQSFLDQSGFLPPNVDPTSPAQVSTYGDEIGGVCDMYFNTPNNNNLYQNVFGVPFSPGPSTAADAAQEIANLVTLGLVVPGGVSYFQWVVAPAPPPGSAACSWTIKVRSWRRANSFPVSAVGILGTPMFVPAKGKTVAIDPVKTITVNSGGVNPSACNTRITVTPSTMEFTAVPNFS
jgi:hypothetical protein